MPIRKRFAVAGILLLALLILLLEVRLPYYFTQDDNHSSFLPIILHGCRAVFSGVFPTWNPYQYLGAPTTTIGIYSLTYPFLYFAYGVARFLFGNEYLTLEVYAVVNIVIAFLICYRLLMTLGIPGWSAMCGAFCIAVSGYQLIAGRSWYYMLPVAVYFPWLLTKFFQLKKAPKIPKYWILSTGLLSGLWYHAGNAQMWFYGTVFLALICVLWIISRELTFEKVKAITLAGAFGAGIALPLLLLQTAEARDRYVDTTIRGIGNCLISLFLPYPLVKSGYPGEVAGSNPMGVLYFSGGVFFISFFLVVGLSIGAVNKRNIRSLLSANACAIMGVIALILSLGDEGGLWTILTRIPPFTKFALPYKFLGFIAIFSVISGIVFLKNLSLKKAVWLLPALSTAAMVFSFWNGWNATTSFYSFADRPYPEGPKQFEHFRNGRIFYEGPDRCPHPNFTSGLPLNYPTVYKIMAFGGYDVSVESSKAFRFVWNRQKDSKRELREYGVRWIASPYSVLPESYKALGIVAVQQIGSRYFHRIENPRPIVFERNSGIALDYALRADGFDIKLMPSAHPNDIIANFVRRPWMKTTDQSGQEISLVFEPYGRIAFRVPSGISSLSVRYSPPWQPGLLFGFLLMVPALFVTFVDPIRKRKAQR